MHAKNGVHGRRQGRIAMSLITTGEKCVLSAQTPVNRKKDKNIIAVLFVNCGSSRNHEDEGKRKREKALN